MRIYPDQTQDEEFKTLGDAGFLGSFNDRQFSFLRGRGFSNSLADMIEEFKRTGGGGPVAAAQPIIIVEGDSNTGFGFDTLNWSKTAITLSGPRVWLPPGGHLANPGGTVAYSLSDNSMVARQATTEAIIGAYPGRQKIVMFSIGTNSEANQAGTYAATAELEAYLTALKAVDPGNVTTICVLPLYNTDLGNQTRIDNQGTWAASSPVVDHVFDAKTLGLGNMGRPNTHMDDDQHFAVGEAVAALLATIVPASTPYDEHEMPFYADPMTGFAAVSGTGFSGVLPTGWTAARTTGDGSVVLAETTVGGFPAIQITATGNTNNSTFRLRKTITYSADAGAILDAFATVDLVSYTEAPPATVPYLAINAGGGTWPNNLVAGLDVNPNDWDGPLIYRSYVQPLAAAVTSLTFDLMLTVEPGQTAVVTFSRPVMAEVGASSATAPAALTAPVMASATAGQTPTHTPGTYSGNPTPSISFAYYVDGEAVGTDFVLTEGEVVEVRETATNVAGSASQTSASITVGAASSAVAPWDAALNTSPEQIAYSDSDRTASATAALNGIRNIRGNDALTGKRYFEVDLSTFGWGAGVCTSAVTTTTGGTNGVVRSYWTGTLLYRTGGTQAMGFNITTGGGIVQVAVDADARLIWVRRNGAGDWNNTPGADPATGAGGADISGLVGDIYAYAALQNNTSASVVLHGTADRFTYTAPSGFTAIA